MAWANSSNVSTANLDAGTDSPAAARADLKAALDELILVINGRATANGVAPLNASSKIANTYLPDSIVSSTGADLNLTPNTGKVNLNAILNLTPQTVAQLNARTDKTAGDAAYCSDGDTGSACIAVYNGTDWKVISLGATIST